MNQTACTYSTEAFLSDCNNEKPILQIKGKIPTNYTHIIITDYTLGKVILPAGFDENGVPYFSDEFYRKLRTEYDEIIKIDKEWARKLFWFNVRFENCKM